MTMVRVWTNPQESPTYSVRNRKACKMEREEHNGIGYEVENTSQH